MEQQEKQFTYEDFCIHFNLANNKHEIPVSQSIATEQSLNIIIQELNKHLFNNQMEIHLVVLPAEDGSLIKRFWIVLYTAGVFVVGSMFPDITNWVLKWLTWKEVKDFAEDWTIQMKNVIQGFIEKDNRDLVDIWVKPQQFYKAYEAKNKFYQSALSNDDVLWVGFDNTERFPIKTWDFYHRIYDLKEVNTWLEPIDKYHKLTVVSAINTKEDKDLAWQVKDPKIKKRFSVYMKDEDFYEFFLENPMYISSMLVKVRYHLTRDNNDQITIERKEITRVYQYNSKVFFSLPEDAKIEPAPMLAYDIDWTQVRTKDISDDSVIEGQLSINDISIE